MGDAPLPRPIRTEHQGQIVVPIARAPIPERPPDTTPSAATRRTLDRRWLGFSALCHGLILAVLLFGLPTAAPLPPVHVLKITLVPRGPGGQGVAGGNGGSEQSATVAKPETPPTASRSPSPPVKSSPPLAPASPPVMAAASPAPPHAKPMPPVRPVALLPPPPPKPKRIPPRHRVAHRAPPHRPMPHPSADALPSPPATMTASLSPSAPAAAPSPGAGQGPGGHSGEGIGTAGAGHGAIGTGVGPGDNYLERLYRHLLHYKKYPAAAMRRKEQGKVVIGFTIARDGRVSDVHIEESSGHPDIDRATLDLVRRAAPMPPLPPSFKGNEARVKFPIDYRLSLFQQMF
ncbi:MAG: energy transducer TonB [Stellaceae bacterium]